MNSPFPAPDRDPRAAGVLDAVTAVLAAQQAEESDDAEWAPLVLRLAGGPDPAIAAAITRSSLGEPVGGPGTEDAVTPADIARVLRRADELARRPLVDPRTEWASGMAALLAAGMQPLERICQELNDLGFPLTPGCLTERLAAAPVQADRELMQSIVTLLGGDWAGGAWEVLFDSALYDSALYDTSVDLGELSERALDDTFDSSSLDDLDADLLHGRQRSPEPATRRPSGFSGADVLTSGALLTQVRPPVENLPDRVHGRDVVLRHLLAVLEGPSQRTQIVAGKGGVGKTTVALAAVAAAQRAGQHVWWVTASDPNQVTRGMLAVASDLGAPIVELNVIQADPARGVELVWKRLQRSRRRWLLVFDDADEPEVLSIPGPDHPDRWFRTCTAGTVLITTRVGDHAVWGRDITLTELDDLRDVDGAQVILDRIGAATPVDAGLARLLSTRLGGVALALRNVGDYLASGVAQQTIGQLVDSLDTRRIADSHVVSADPRSRIATTWDLSLDALAREGLPESRPLLRLLARFAPGRWVIPLDLIAPEHLDAVSLPTGGADRPRWAEALDGLARVGLIERKLTDGQRVPGVALHPLVTEVSLDDDTLAEVAVVDAAAVALLWRVVADLDGGRPRDWPALRRLEPHVYAVVEAVGSKDAQADALRLADRTAVGLIKAGLFGLGEQLLRHARSFSPLGGEHSDMLATDHTLAWALGLRGELAEAQARLTTLIAARATTVGADDESTLNARDHLAWVLAEQGRLARADGMWRAVLRGWQRRGATAPDRILAIRHRIAWVAALKGHPDEAERQFREILPQRVVVHGADHMEVFSTRYRLAWSVAAQGRVKEAEPLFMELAYDLERVLTRRSAPLIMVQSRLGYVHAIQGRFDESEDLYRTVLASRTELLGADHPRTLRARHDIAWALAMRGDPRGAERGYREVLADEKQLLGPDHPLTQETRARLAALLVTSGRLGEAQRRLTALIGQQHRLAGPDHLGTLQTRVNLGLVLMSRGRLSEAQEQLETALEHQVRVLGTGHRHVLGTRMALAKVHGKLGDLVGAQHEIEDVLAASQRLLDPGHQHNFAVRNALVWLLGERGMLTEAEQQSKTLRDDEFRILGATHPITLETVYRLGWLAGLDGRGGEAEQIYRGLLTAQNQVLGREHRETIRTRHGIAYEMLRAGRADEAERDLRGVLLDRTRVLGKYHPDTLSSRHVLAFARALRGEHAEAAQSLTVLLIDQIARLGPEHRDTLNTRERLAWVQEKRGLLQLAEDEWYGLLLDRERILGMDHPDTRRTRLRTTTPSHVVSQFW